MNYKSYASGLEHMAAKLTEKLPRGEHVSLRKLQAEILRLRDGVNALGTLNSTPNPTETQATHERRVAVAAGKFDKSITATRDRMQSIVKEGLWEIAKRIDLKVNLHQDGFASEVRASYRLMSGVEKAAVLHELAESNRGPELAALIKSPRLLTGISEEMQSRFENFIIAKHAPDEYYEQAALMESFDAALLVAPDFARDMATEYADPVKLAKIAADEAAAIAAVAKLDAAIA